MDTSQPYFRISRQVKRNFNNAAKSYDKTAELQKTVGGSLLDRLDLVKVMPETIIDLGCGSGRASRLLARRYKKARVYEVDFALSMLQASAGNTPMFFSRQRPVCARAEQVPFADNTVDLVFSNLMLQWCNDPDGVFAEARRVLKTGGLLIFSSLGPDTLHELRESWAKVDQHVHVNAFIDMHDLGDALIRAGFENPVMEVEPFTLTYEDGYALMRDLKQIGAQNSNLGRRTSLTGKGRIRKMLAEYEHHRRDGRLPASYEVVYGHAWLGDGPAKLKRAASPVTVPVSAITKRNR